MRTAALLVACLALAATGCKRNATWLPNSDASLNKPAIAFAEDAKTRFPYPADLQHLGETRGRAEVGYDANVVNLVNYSGEAWTNVDLWINKTYVLHLETVATGKSKWLPFELFYNEAGERFPNNGKVVELIELKKDNAVYTIPHRIGG